MLHRLRTLSTIAAGSLALAGIAAAAGASAPCHPNLPGTRSLTVTGAVTGYRFTAPGTLAVSIRTTHCAGLDRWNYAATPQTTASVSCGGSSAAGFAKKLVATEGDRTVRVVLAPSGVDRPNRLDVFARSTGRRIASWPLIAWPLNAPPARVVLYGGFAVISQAGRGALYALRLSDGKIGELGIGHAGDRPIIGPAGVVYQEDQYAKTSRDHLSRTGVLLKVVPLASVSRQIRLADPQIVTPGQISAIGMDGQRVAFAVHDPAGKCDSVMFWLPTWHFLAHVTHPTGPSCLPTHAAGGITNIAMASARVIWTTKYGQTTRILAASAIGCSEWVVARPAGGAPVAALAGDGNVLGYALRSGKVGLVPKHWRGQVISQSPAHVAGMSVDSNRIATLYRDGTVTVMTATGAPVSSIAAGSGASAVALRGNTLAVVEHGHLAIYDATTGVRTQSWSVPAGSRAVDLHYGIAVVTAGRDVVAVNVATGHSARLLRAPGRVAARIDSPGAIVEFNAGGHGHLQFIPMSTIEARTR